MIENCLLKRFTLCVIQKKEDFMWFFCGESKLRSLGLCVPRGVFTSSGLSVPFAIE